MLGRLCLSGEPFSYLLFFWSICHLCACLLYLWFLWLSDDLDPRDVARWFLYEYGADGMCRKDSHLLLTTLILGNMIVNEALPVVTDGVLGGGIQAVVISTALVVM